MHQTSSMAPPRPCSSPANVKRVVEGYKVQLQDEFTLSGKILYRAGGPPARISRQKSHAKPGKPYL